MVCLVIIPIGELNHDVLVVWWNDFGINDLFIFCIAKTGIFLMLSLNAWLQIGCYLAIVLVCAKPLGWYMARIYQGQYPRYVRFLSSLESLIYRVCRIDPQQEMTWKQYAIAMLLLNGCGLIAVYAAQRLQYYLPGNPQHLLAPNIGLAFNTAISYVTNTNWQAYAGERTLSYGTQMVAMTSQNFLSAATGIAILLALIRGINGHKGQYLGNYWVDMVRSVLYILLPLACILALALVSQGVIQNLKPNQIQFTVFGSPVPAINILPINLPYGGQNMYVAGNVRPAYPPLNLKYVVDNGYKNYWILWKWLNSFNDANDSFSSVDIPVTDPWDNDIRFTNKFSEFVTNFTLYALDEYNNRIMSFIYKDVFITGLGEINFNHQTQEDIIGSATFVYNQFIVDVINNVDNVLN